MEAANGPSLNGQGGSFACDTTPTTTLQERLAKAMPLSGRSRIIAEAQVIV
jgi:hypothetical protein